MPWHGVPEIRAKLWDSRERRRTQWEQIMATAVRTVFQHQNTRILRVVKEMIGKAGKPSPAHVVHALQSVGGKRARDEVYHAAAAVIRRIFRTEGSGAFAFAASFNPRRAAKPKPDVPVGYSWGNDALRHLAKRQNLIKGVSDRRFGQIMDVVRDAMLSDTWDGGSGAIADELRRFFEGDDARALLVARTESGSAANAAAKDGYKAGGADGKSWLPVPDDGRNRPEHLEMDGETVTIDEAFSNGLQFPGDPLGPPEEVCNCRCTLLPEWLA
jgi:hypothetical protein